MQVSPFYSPVVGGVEEVVRRIAEYMASRGHEVHVVTYNRLRSDGLGSLPREEVINGVHVIRLRPRFTWSHGSYSPELPDVIRSLRPDVVHVHVWRHPHVFQVARLKGELGFTAVLHGHSPFHTLSQLGLVTWLYHRLADAFGRGALAAYDAYIALTSYESRVVQGLGLDEGKIHVIPNGIDEDRCSADLDSRSGSAVLYLGRVSKSKNLGLLAKSMEYVRGKAKEVKLVIAGPDEGLVNEVISYVRSHGVKAEYLGAVSEGEKHRLYSASDVYAFPSTFEPFGITLLEAEAHGTPPVITGQGGQVEVAPPGVVGLWARPKPRDFGEAIAELLTNESLRRKLAYQARQWSQRFTWGRLLPKYEELYGKLTA
ncbi:glycosyltransferase family 4 protein [Acidilobus saccharovorans]|uniref:glycosyltransferase family 4 protein n=1 Tax=Acidilobus saccharovorans TaxID=242703 RepID=UPI001EE5E8D1|nr:glycosyltransferase family 4 protein [Acidilobus saccharovorans]